MASPRLSTLSTSDRERLETWLVQFDKSWNDQALSAHADRLNELPESIRFTALVELVKIDLERQWQQGARVTLDSYLQQYPALGTSESVPADLILAEYEIRRQFKVPAELDEFIERFPNQQQEFRELLAGADAARSRASAPMAEPPQAQRDTSKAAISTGGTGKNQPKQKLPREFGRYRILKRLGEGGMGAVYLAHDTQLDRKVALKIPRFSARKKDEIVNRFFREARAAATIRHPNVCPVYDVGEIDGIYYLTMAYIQGRTLSEFIRPEKPLPERQVAAVVSKLALALQEAHDCGVVHRDLKPSNIMIDRRNEPVIMDFGLARRTDAEESRATQQGTILGTPAYMSPEQVLGDPEKIGPQTDVYSLGVILYELLTAQLPYQGPPTAVVGQILATDPPPPQQHRTDLDPRLVEICAKAMAKEREDRYQSMKHLAVALTEYLKHAQKAPAKPAAKQPPQKAADHDSMEQAFANIAASGTQTARRPSSKPLAARLQQLAPLARRHRKTLVAVAAAFFFLFLCGVIIKINLRDKTVTIESDSPNTTTEVSDDGKKITVQTQTQTPTKTVESEPTNPPPAGQPPLAIAPFNTAQAKQHQQAWADYLGLPVEQLVELPGGEKLTMVLIPPGEFMMGSPPEEKARFLEAAKVAGDKRTAQAISDNEEDQRLMRIDQPFRLSSHEVTRGQFRQFVDDTGYRTDVERTSEIDRKRRPWSQLAWHAHLGFEQTDYHPVVNVSWNDAVAFCQWLSKQQRPHYALPTETQWEYGCRAGTTSVWYFGDDETMLDEYAWSNRNSDGQTHPVGQLLSNAFGLFDMHGNVQEWCADRWSGNYWSGDHHRAARGGSWNRLSEVCRSARRCHFRHDSLSPEGGFRVACSIPKKPSQNANLPPRTPPSNTTVPANWQTWSHSLKTPDALDSLYCASGQYGNYGTWFLAKVMEGEGIKIYAGFTQTALWAPVSVGTSYRVSLEAMQGDEFPASRVRLLLGGPGYGNSTETSYCVLVREKDAVLMREGIECCSASLPSPKVPGRWFHLEAKVDRGDIHVLFDGVPFLKYTDPQPLVGPLHGWIGFVGRGATWYRNLQINAPDLNENTDKQLLPPASDTPLPNGPVVYELPMDQQTIEKDWWLSWPDAVNVKDGSLDLRDPNSVSLLLLDRPLHGNVAMETEIEYPSAETLNFQMAFWAGDEPPQELEEHPKEEPENGEHAWTVDKLPKKLEDKVGGWFVWLPDALSNTSLHWHDQTAGYDIYWYPKSAPLAATPYHSPARGHRYVARLEAVGDRARLFLDGRLILDAKRPTDASGKDLPLYAAIGQRFAPVFVHSLRIYQLDDNAEQSLPKIETPDRRAAEWVLRTGASVALAWPDGRRRDEIRRVDELGDEDFRVTAVNLTCNLAAASGVQHLAGLSDLERLYVGGIPITDSDLRFFDDSTKLQLAHLWSTKVTDEGIAQFVETHPALVELWVHHTALTDAALVHIAKLQGLEDLNLDNTAVTDAGMEAVGKIKSLKRFLAASNGITDQGLQHLANFKPRFLLLDVTDIKGPGLDNLNPERLAILSLRHTPIDDAGIKHLAHLANLNHLALDGTAITDSALDVVGKFDKLLSLSLIGTQVTDAGLEKLRNLENLNELHPHDTSVTITGVKHLQSALPKCHILSNASEPSKESTPPKTNNDS